MKPAVFFDRDNTLIHNDGDLGDPEQVKLIQGAATAIASLQGLGFKIVVVSNQGGVARGKFTEEQVEQVHERVRDLVKATTGASIDQFYYCPYHPEGTVKAYRREHPWRKPQPGMLLEAAKELDIDLTQSWLVGDQARDIAAGMAAQVRSVLLRAQAKQVVLGAQADRGWWVDQADDDGSVTPSFVAPSLSEAVKVIAQQRKPEIGGEWSIPKMPSPPKRVMPEAKEVKSVEVKSVQPEPESDTPAVKDQDKVSPAIAKEAAPKAKSAAGRASKKAPVRKKAKARRTVAKAVDAGDMPARKKKVARPRRAIKAKAKSSSTEDIPQEATEPPVEKDQPEVIAAQAVSSPPEPPPPEVVEVSVSEPLEAPATPAPELPSVVSEVLPRETAAPPETTEAPESVETSEPTKPPETRLPETVATDAAGVESASPEAVTPLPEVAPVDRTPPNPSPVPVPVPSKLVEITLRQILQELRRQRPEEADFSHLGVLAIVMQMVAGVCLLGALWMGSADDWQFIRWIGAGLVVQLMTIAILLFRR